MADGFSVSPEELERLAGQLDEVRDDLTQVGDDADGADAYSEDLGHEGLTDVVRSSDTNWSVRRRELADNVGALADSARGAARSYRETDDSVGSTFESQAAPAQGQPGTPV